MNYEFKITIIMTARAGHRAFGLAVLAGVRCKRMFRWLVLDMPVAAMGLYMPCNNYKSE